MKLKLSAVLIGIALIAYNLGGLFLTFTTPETFYLSPGEGTITQKSSNIIALSLLILTTTILLFTSLLKMKKSYKK